MSWPQNPNDPWPPAQPGQPTPPGPGFGPPPAWPSTGGQTPAAPPPVPQPYPAPPYAPGQPPGQPPGPYAGYAYPAPPPPPPPTGRGRRAVLIGVGIAVVLALIGGVLYLVTSDHPKGSPQAAHSGGPTAPAGPQPSDQGPDLNNGSVQPMIAGWQTQTQAEHGFRFDVPPSSAKWTVNQSDIQIAYQDANGDPIVAMSGTAEYREGGCASNGPSSGAIQAGRGQLATVGTQGSSGGTLQKNAYNVAGNWVWAAYGGPTNKNIHISPTKPVRWTHNGIDGYMVRATATNIVRPSACVPPRAVSYGIAQRLPDGTVSEWVLFADQDVPNALTTAQITRIMDTVRPYHGE